MFSTSSHSGRPQLRFALRIAFALLVALLATSCRKQEASVVSQKAEAPPITAASARPASTAVAQASPTTEQPVGPAGQAPAAPPAGARRGPTMKSIPFTTSVARPSPSGRPEPPPRPAPPPVIVDGKIVQQWQAPPEAAKLLNPVKGQRDAAQVGRSYYMQKCDACHGKEGRGNGWMSRTISKPPTDLTSAMVQANTDGELFWKITNGRSPMPAHKVRFDDEQRWYIVAFLRTLK